MPAPLVMMYPASAYYCDVHCQRWRFTQSLVWHWWINVIHSSAYYFVSTTSSTLFQWKILWGSFKGFL